MVADGAQILANQRSARAVAALSLVGCARWCVVERENMAAVENSSERMRVSFRCRGWGGVRCASLKSAGGCFSRTEHQPRVLAKTFICSVVDILDHGA